MVALVTGVFCLPFVLLTLAALDMAIHSSSRFHYSRWIVFCESAAAWFLGLVFLTGGMSKLVPFPGVMGPVWLESALEPYGLALYARFIAWAEVVIGLLLLARPTRVLAAIMLVPLLLNILMVTVSMEWRGTPWVIVFFLTINLFLLTYHYPRWRSVVACRTTHIRSRTGSALRPASVWLAVVLVSPMLAGISIWLCWLASGLGLAGLAWNEWVWRFARTNLPEQQTDHSGSGELLTP